MSENYFDMYTDRELMIACLWINKLGLFKIIKGIQEDHTGYHDLKVIVREDYAKEFGDFIILEVKEEEDFWFSKTGNIGLDYISAFSFKDKASEEYWKREKNFWVPPEEIENFEKDIIVKKWGKLKTCDAHLQIFYVEDKESNKPKFLQAYCNRCLQRLTGYLRKHYKLRINNKSLYGSKEDTWESAAYFVNPVKDPFLRECEINTLEDLKKCLKGE